MDIIEITVIVSEKSAVFGFTVDEINIIIVFAVFAVLAGLLYLLIVDAAGRLRSARRRGSTKAAFTAAPSRYADYRDRVRRLLKRLCGPDGHFPPASGRKFSDVERITAALVLLSGSRHALSPNELSSENFPNDLDVISFDSGGWMRIRCIESTGRRILLGGCFSCHTS